MPGLHVVLVGFDLGFLAGFVFASGFGFVWYLGCFVCGDYFAGLWFPVDEFVLVLS